MYIYIYLRHHRDAGQLPDYVVHLIEDTSKHASSKRSLQTNAIHRLFTRHDDGSMTLNLKDGLFSAAQTIYSNHYSKGTKLSSDWYYWSDAADKPQTLKTNPKPKPSSLNSSIFSSPPSCLFLLTPASSSFQSE